MSQNYYNDKDVLLLIGWDRPLKCAFIKLNKLTPSKVEWGETLLDLDYYPESEANIKAMIIDIKRKLTDFNIIPPIGIFKQLAEDVKSRAGNTVLIHSQNGSSIECNGGEDPVSFGYFK